MVKVGVVVKPEREGEMFLVASSSTFDAAARRTVYNQLPASGRVVKIQAFVI